MRYKYRWDFGYSAEDDFKRKQYYIAYDNGLPIPDTGRRHGGHWHRRPRNVGVVKEMNNQYDHHFKRLKRPPNSYDDINHARKGNGWKNYRKTQWRNM